MDCGVTVVDCLGDLGPGAFCTQAQYMRGVSRCAVLTDISPISAAVEISISSCVIVLSLTGAYRICMRADISSMPCVIRVHEELRTLYVKPDCARTR